MKPDISFLRPLIALLILSALFFVIERLLGRGRKQAIIRRGWRTDVIYWFTTVLLTKPFVRLMLILPIGLLLLAKITIGRSVTIRPLHRIRTAEPAAHLASGDRDLFPGRLRRLLDSPSFSSRTLVAVPRRPSQFGGPRLAREPARASGE